MHEHTRSATQEAMQPSAPHSNQVVAALAARQHGVVGRRQLLAIGLTPAMVDGRVARGWLIPLHRGVYAVGHRHLRREGHLLAAVLAVGPGTVLSHRSAAALHGIRPSTRPAVDVATPRQGRRGRPGIDVHVTTVLGRGDVTVVDGVPVTTVARTLVDLASVVPADHLAKALDTAERLRILDLRSLRAALRRTRGRRGGGHAALAAALAEHVALGTTLTRSELEARFGRLVRDHALPQPRTNVHVEGIEVDALWPEQRLVVELDGWRYHRTERAFERDRERSNLLVVAGYRVARFTHDDLVRRSDRTAQIIGDLLDTPPAVVEEEPRFERPGDAQTSRAHSHVR